jgi:lysophospholipase L1-like esterase
LHAPRGFGSTLSVRVFLRTVRSLRVYTLLAPATFAVLGSSACASLPEVTVHAKAPAASPSPVGALAQPTPPRNDTITPDGTKNSTTEVDRAPRGPVLPPFEPTERALAHVQRALFELEHGARSKHVRVLWLGDSHGQADFWSGRLRTRLAERFGDAGPGFLFTGYKNYRHDGVRLDVSGRWRMLPKSPVSTRRQGDGVFGLGGLTFEARSRDAQFSATVGEGAAGRRFTLDICHRFTAPDGSLTVRFEGDDGPQSITLSPEGSVRAGLLHSVHRVHAGRVELIPRGATQLCGAVLESEIDPAGAEPGVTVDTLAINGARVGTALAWEREPWAAEVARRSPALVIVEYGTNEAGDPAPSYERVGRQVGELVDRVRTAAPGADCLVVSPTDRADAEERASAMRDAMRTAAMENGCAWFDAWEWLGGRGATTRLATENPPRAQPDGVHLTPRGYRALGDALFEVIVARMPPSARATASSKPTTP